MASIRCVELLKHARDNHYAVGYFEAWSLESLLAIVRAAEIARSPVMTGFCGEYLASPARRFTEEIGLYGEITKKVAAGSSVPVATLLNESTDMNVAYRGIQAVSPRHFPYLRASTSAAIATALARSTPLISTVSRVAGRDSEAEISITAASRSLSMVSP